MNRKRGGRGSFIKGGKGGVGLCSVLGVGPPCAALERRDFLKAQSHTLTSMMGTTSALRRSNEQQFSA
ncbi:hypothetical protein VNO78_35247 [Psophocarpus tetragonolobus]|uniref:Uncharacterized protein n=1 Tax=Psophocarpus tetragonolobus TaxID=3891 RepID=A0AAN9RLT6_PSOTE